MKILIIDTSYSNAFSVALVFDNTLLSISSTFSTTNNINFWSSLEKLFNLSRVSKTEIDVVAVSVGPGPFTALRNGISVARTISQILSIPITKFSLIEVVENMFVGDSPVILFDGRAGKLLVKKPNSGLELVSVKNFNLDVGDKIVAVGCKKILEENNIVKEVLNFDFLPIDAIAEVVKEKVNTKEFYDYNEVLPIYYKSPGVS